MTLDFIWSALPSRVVFAPGALLQAGDEVDRLGVSRVLLIGGGAATSDALARLSAVLGARVVGKVADAAQHVPAQMADAAVATARDTRADVVVTLGGGSATGLGKAVSLECDLPAIAVPTTVRGLGDDPDVGAHSGRRETDGPGCSGAPENRHL